MSNSETLNAGIIGVGGIANGKHMPGLDRIDNVRMTAFCDIIEERAQAGATNYGTDDIRVFTDYRRMLEECDLDVVHVCTPNSSHSELACAALEAGCHVMCEKPMAKTAAGALKMVETAERTGMKLTIGYQNRMRPETIYLKRLVEQGELGEIYYAKATCLRRRGVPTWGVFLDKEKQGGGSLIDIGTHALDLTLWLMDNYEPESVTGTAFYKLGQREGTLSRHGTWNPENFTVEDSAFGFIKFANGAVVQLETSWALNILTPAGIKSTLCGTEGGADIDNGLRVNGEHRGRLYSRKVDMGIGGESYYEQLGLKPQRLETQVWIDTILNDWEPIVKPRQALVVTQILEAIYQSSETGEAVKL